MRQSEEKQSTRERNGNEEHQIMNLGKAGADIYTVNNMSYPKVNFTIDKVISLLKQVFL